MFVSFLSFRNSSPKFRYGSAFASILSWNNIVCVLSDHFAISERRKIRAISTSTTDEATPLQSILSTNYTTNVWTWSRWVHSCFERSRSALDLSNFRVRLFDFMRFCLHGNQSTSQVTNKTFLVSFQFIRAIFMPNGNFSWKRFLDREDDYWKLKITESCFHHKLKSRR